MANKIISRTSTIRLNGSLDDVFPLFGPVREQEWEPHWRPRFALPYSEPAQEHMVFQTVGHDPPHPTYTWVLSKLQPTQGLIEYTVFADARVWWITIQCQQKAPEPSTDASVTYTYLGMSDEANVANERALESMFRHELKDWEAAINGYLDARPAAASTSSQDPSDA